jgi:hypothetical protein
LLLTNKFSKWEEKFEGTVYIVVLFVVDKTTTSVRNFEPTPSTGITDSSLAHLCAFSRTSYQYV